MSELAIETRPGRLAAGIIAVGENAPADESAALLSDPMNGENRQKRCRHNGMRCTMVGENSAASAQGKINARFLRSSMFFSDRHAFLCGKRRDGGILSGCSDVGQDPLGYRRPALPGGCSRHCTS